MNLNREQVGMAIQAGLELLGPESDVAIPAKLNDGVFLLKQLLGGIAQGKIALSPAVEQEPPAGAQKPEAAPNRKERRTAAAQAKKVSKKKS